MKKIPVLSLQDWWDYMPNARMAKYWAAKEMADWIMFDIAFAYNNTPEERDWLAQALKKEWFRK